MRIYSILVLVLSSCILYAQPKSRKSYTNSKPYDQVIADFKALDVKSDIISMNTFGMTDAGLPLHVLVVSSDKIFTPGKAKEQGKCIIMINNAIHPGEPDGVDATYEMLSMYAEQPHLLPVNVVLVVIPVYNIDGYLNRGSFSRANQNGPEQYGFRANAKNLDLNRDFIKADAQNTISFEQIFQQWKPDILIDNHVSDGSDYQYTMSLIVTQRNKLNPLLATYCDTKLVPGIYSDMKRLGQPICPYVETMGETPETGIVGFMESPRFATGYAALFNCIGFVPETHMLKPYNDRVWATFDLMITMINRTSSDAKEIVRLHQEADAAVAKQEKFVLSWKLDTTKYEMIDFNGYESTHITSKVTGLPVLHYDRTKPYTKKVRFYNTYIPQTTVTKPEMYIIPQAWTDVIYRLQINGIRLRRLLRDTAISSGYYQLTDVKHPSSPYESHYLHRGTQVSESIQTVQYHKGDYVVETNQVGNRYIVETLEPQSDDSFFAWNFFDGVLNQKEWFSDYIFDGKAEQILIDNPSIKMELDSARAVDTTLAKSHWNQLYFVYERSAYKEPTHNRYPVALVRSPIKLPIE